jgi:hypothetical protein
VRYSRSVTGTPACLSSWKKVANIAAFYFVVRFTLALGGAKRPQAYRARRLTPNGKRA